MTEKTNYRNESETASSKDLADDNTFPGYPHYPTKEDIMRSENIERVDIDVENLSRSHNITHVPLADKSVHIPQSEVLHPALGDMDDDNVKIVQGTEADVTEEDLLILNNMDGELGNSEEYTGENLDVPGAEEDDANEEIGEEDEENNYYSLGGDAHENLEEDQAGEKF